MSEDSLNWNRSKSTIREAGTFVVEGLAAGDMIVQEVAHTSAFFWSDIQIQAVPGARLTVSGVDWESDSDLTPGSKGFSIEVYKYAADEDPYEPGLGDITVRWRRVGGSARDPA